MRPADSVFWRAPVHVRFGRPDRSEAAHGGGGARAPGRDHGRNPDPSWSGRFRCLGRPGGGLGARLSAPLDRRPLARRAPAHDLRQRSPRDRLQRRDLQRRAAAPGARGQGCHISRSFRHRGHPGGLRGLGCRRGGRTFHRHVRLRRMGPARAAASPGSGPIGHQAAVLRAGRPNVLFRLSTQELLSAPRLARAARPRGAGRISAVQLRPQPPLDLPGAASGRTGRHGHRGEFLAGRRLLSPARGPLLGFP